MQYSNVMLFVPSRRIRAITRGEAEHTKIMLCAELFYPELLGQSVLLFRPSERIRAVVS